MKMWQSVLLSLILCVILILGSVSLGFKIAPLFSAQAQIIQNQQRIANALNQQEQRLRQLEESKRR